MNWTNEFPGLSQSTYLNSCSYGLLPRRTRRAIEQHLGLWESAPDWDVWAASIDAARRGFAKLIGAHADEIAIQANASSGLASVMSTIREGRVCTLDIDFPTSGFLAERQRARGLSHEHLKLGLYPRVDQWAPHVEGAALACVPAVASFTGYRLDTRAFVAAAHDAGVPVVVDAFQAAGTFPIDVHRDDVDFLVTGVYKWLMAPSGLAFLYAKREHHERLPTTSGWYAARAPYEFDPLDELAPDARRFEYGGTSIIACAAAVESFKLIEEVGLASIERHARKLVDRVIEKARDRKYEVLTPESRASIVTFRVPDLERALAACARERVMVNSRIGGIRVSPHFYNTEADIDRLFEVLDRA